MLLRDPIHGLVAFEDRLEKLVLALMDTREVQRLRRIRQLGLSSLVFPGAEHTRFSHAIGTAHVMRKLIARLRRVESELPVHLRVDAHLEVCAIAAALVHDLGHGPFSHLFEEVLPHQRRHETWTRMIVESETTDVHRALLQFGAETPGEVVKLLNGTHRCAWLSRWISGVIDVDRCDYLLRDSQMAGVAYGIYDLDWLFEALTFAELPGREQGRDSTPRDSRWSVVIEGRKGLPPLEGFFLARHFMYGQVYHHKATRAAEALIRALFVRLRELIESDVEVPFLPHAIARAVTQKPRATGQKMSLAPASDDELHDYLELDDATLHVCFAEWQRHPDSILSDLAQRIRDRRLPKTLPLESQDPDADVRLTELARDICQQRGLRPDLYVSLDIAHDTPYGEDPNDEESGLWVSLRHQPLQRLSSLSFTLERLVGEKIVRRRLCFPAEIRQQLESAL